jgi:hypothetical protein
MCLKCVNSSIHEKKNQDGNGVYSQRIRAELEEIVTSAQLQRIEGGGKSFAPVVPDHESRYSRANDTCVT